MTALFVLCSVGLAVCAFIAGVIVGRHQMARIWEWCDEVQGK